MDEAFPAVYGVAEDDVLQILRQMGFPASEAGRLHHEQIQDVIDSLTIVKEEDLVALGKQDAACPICMTPFLALLAEEEMALAMDSPAYSSRQLGVVKLARTCGHIFCRKDISKWILAANDSCPLCRQALLPRTEGSTASETPNGSDNVPGADPRAQRESTPELLERLFRQANMFVPNPSGRSFHEDSNEYSGMYS